MLTHVILLTHVVVLVFGICEYAFLGGPLLKELDLLIVVYISRQLFSILELYFPQIFDSILPPSSSQVFDFEKIAEYSHSVSTVLYLLSF